MVRQTHSLEYRIGMEINSLRENKTFAAETKLRSSRYSRVPAENGGVFSAFQDVRKRSSQV